MGTRSTWFGLFYFFYFTEVCPGALS